MPTDIPFQFDLVVRLVVAAILGAVVGLEREVHDHPAGMRTHLLVSVGSATFTVLSIVAFPGTGSDPGRVAAQIVSGIGFLGAGAILKYGASVRGLTTAASLWAVAAVGMAAGAGAWVVAVAATVIVLISLSPLHFVENRLVGNEGGRLRVRIDVAGEGALGRVLRAVAERDEQVRHLASSRMPEGGHQVDLEIRGRSAKHAAEILEELGELEGIEVATTAPAGD
jgi:putative Mg2+ transporter-C (MgtC) family protein